MPFTVASIVLIGLIALVAAKPSLRDGARYLYWRFANRRRLQHGYVEADDCRLYCESTGSGEVLVLLHGGLTSFHVWYRQIPVLSRSFQILCVDMRGHGRSSRGVKPLSYRLLAADIVRVLDTRNVQSAHVAGWSDGGNVAIMLAIFHPARVKRVVAISANAFPDGINERQRLWLSSDSATRVPFWASWVHRQAARRRQLEELWRDVTSMWSTRPRLSMDELRSVSVPVLLIRGEFDDVSEAHAREMNAALVNSRLTTIAAVGHRVLQQAPDAVNRQLLRFLLVARAPDI